MALADSGSQVNMVTPSFMHQHKFPILLLGDLVDYPLNLIGLEGTRMRPMGFMILQVQVSEITCYDEDVIFLVSGRSRISSGWGVPSHWGVNLDAGAFQQKCMQK